MSTNPKNTPQESDLLVPFERENLPADYKEYYLAKRHNFFASIQGFDETWGCYMLLDKIWLREFQDIRVAGDPNRVFPLLLYFNAHAKVRISMELAFSGCLAESRSLLRDAVEFVAHAHHILSDPALQIKWLSKIDEEKAFKEVFEKNKKAGLFNGLGELHKMWGELSETGSHATINAMCDRVTIIDDGKNIEYRLNYCGVEPGLWAKSLFIMLLTCFTMEETLYGDYENRLRFDDGLMLMRTEFERRKEQLRRNVIVRYNVQPPQSQSA